MPFEYTESIKKALSIIKECSAKHEDVRLYNSLDYIGLDVNLCIPKLNKLYNADVDTNMIVGAVKVKDFLSFWEPSLGPAPLYPIDNNEVNENNEIESKENETNDEFKFTKVCSRALLILLIGYWSIVFINWLSSNKFSFLKDSESYLEKIVGIGDSIASLFSPEDWFFTIAGWILGPEYSAIFAKVITLLLFGGLSVVITCILFKKEYRKYFHQPIIALLIVLIVILYGGIVSQPCLDYLWTVWLPLIYITITLLGVLFVRICLKLIKTTNSLIIGIVQVVPFVLWLILFIFLKNYFNI